MADEIVVVGAGGILESGPHEKLMESSGEYAAMYRAQAQWFE